MAIHNSLLPIAWMLILSLTISCTLSARILVNEEDPAPLLPDNPAGPVANPVAPIFDPVSPVAPVVDPVSPVAPVVDPVAPVATPVVTPVASVATPVVTPVAPVPTPVVAPGATGAAAAAVTDPNVLVFFMHDIVGGTNPSAVAMTGIVTNPAVSGAVPFSKPNGAVLSVNNGVPQNNNNGGIVSNNNVPFFTGLAGSTSNVLQNSNNGGGGNNFIAGGNGFPMINGAQLPPGMTLQTLMFGTMTAFDDELTEGHEIGSGLVGKAQGFYVASSVDGTSQTMAFTAMFQSGHYTDTLTFFGVHMTAAAESYLAVMGGTGKYLNARGFAQVKTMPPIVDQHNTEGIETLLQFTVYLTY